MSSLILVEVVTRADGTKVYRQVEPDQGNLDIRGIDPDKGPVQWEEPKPPEK